MQLGIFVEAHDDHVIEWDWCRGKIKKERTIQENSKKKFIRNRTAGLKKYHTYVEPCRQRADYLLMKNRDHSYSLYKNLTI